MFTTKAVVLLGVSDCFKFVDNVSILQDFVNDDEYLYKHNVIFVSSGL